MGPVIISRVPFGSNISFTLKVSPMSLVILSKITRALSALNRTGAPQPANDPVISIFGISLLPIASIRTTSPFGIVKPSTCSPIFCLNPSKGVCSASSATSYWASPTCPPFAFPWPSRTRSVLSGAWTTRIIAPGSPAWEFVATTLVPLHPSGLN